jgi:hypothetical protein
MGLSKRTPGEFDALQRRSFSVSLAVIARSLIDGHDDALPDILLSRAVGAQQELAATLAAAAHLYISSTL